MNASLDPLLQKYSCQICQQRKVKCSRTVPCNNCVRHSVECVYRAPAPPNRRRKRAAEQELPDSASKKDASGQSPIYNASYQDPFKDSGNKSCDPCARILTSAGRVSQTDNNLWTRLAEEMPISREGNEESSEEEKAENVQALLSGKWDVSPVDFIPGAYSPLVDISGIHPQVNQALRLWRAYVENISPLLRIIHVPSFQDVVSNAMEDPKTLSKPVEAMLFAVYACAVMSLTDAECSEIMDVPVKTAMLKFQFATQQCLSRANILKTSDFRVFQAFLLHLVRFSKLGLEQ
jgi:hypothetical protein